MAQRVDTVPLHLATSERYLSYAISVITSRALPDVRDGLKPVQRRILYAMYADMGLVSTGRYRKCAGVVGDVMGKYHPHGDSSIYEALVRMAQDFSLRAPLIDGQGNFGSLDGDPPAAFRYTECRLRALAEELLSEIGKSTVDFRPTYDGQRQEPVVLPAQFPHLLVNGSEGIAVGMATRIPPHNLAEVVAACIALIEDRSLTVRDLVQIVKGPDFPTGGAVLTPQSELERIYETGQGTLKVRATWSEVTEDGRRLIVLDSIPYGQIKSKLVEHIGEEVRARRLPQVVDVRDESTDVVRIVLELLPDASAEAVMAYLFKRTDLQASWPVNLTALVPVPGAAVCSPARLDLKQLLEHWLDFRLETVRRRYLHDLEQLRRRIHILEGFAKIFDALDDAIRIIRASSGRKDAAEALIARFELSVAQADAILELQLYKLAQLEIEAIRADLVDKLRQAERIEQLLASDRELWGEVRKELKEVARHHSAPRSTVLGESASLEYDENAYIVAEDTFVVITRDGWIKRQSTYRGLDKVRIREEDEVGWVLRADTRSTLTFFTNHGSAYVLRVGSVPQTTGYGDPIQASFTFADGEVVVGVISNDARHRIPARPLATPEDPPTPYAAAVTVGGRALRFSLPPHAEVSNRAGRRVARVVDGDQVLAVWGLPGEDDPIRVATSTGRAVTLSACELPLLKAVGKGLALVALEPGESVAAFEVGGEGPVVDASAKGRRSWVRQPLILDLEPLDPAAEPPPAPLEPYRVPPRTSPTPEERRAAAEQRAAERQAAAERRAAERRAAAERAAAQRAIRDQKAAERQAAAEQRAAEKQAAAERKAAEQAARATAAAEEKARKVAEREARAAAAEAEKAQKAAERRAESERRAAEKQAAADEKEALRRAAAAVRAEALRVAAEEKAAERARKEAERQAVAQARAAEAEARRLLREEAAAKKDAARLEQEARRQAAAEAARRKEEARREAEAARQRRSEEKARAAAAKRAAAELREEKKAASAARKAEARRALEEKLAARARKADEPQEGPAGPKRRLRPRGAKRSEEGETE